MYFAVFSSKHSKLFSSKIFDRCFITSRKLFPESLWTCLLNPLSEMWKIIEFNYDSNSRVNGLNLFLRNLYFWQNFLLVCYKFFQTIFTTIIKHFIFVIITISTFKWYRKITRCMFVYFHRKTLLGLFPQGSIFSNKASKSA